MYSIGHLLYEILEESKLMYSDNRSAWVWEQTETIRDIFRVMGMFYILIVMVSYLKLSLVYIFINSSTYILNMCAFLSKLYLNKKLYKRLKKSMIWTN